MTNKNINPARRYLRAFFTLCVASLLGLWAWASWGRMIYMDSEYPLWQYKKEKLQASCFPGRTVILGDSRPMANLIPKELGPEWVNLAIGGVTPIELYYSILMLKHCPEPPRKIIISEAPFHYMAAESYWGRTLPFQFLTLEQSFEVQKIAATDSIQNLYGHSPSQILKDKIMNWVVLKSFPSFYLVKLINGIFSPNLSMNRWTLSDQEENRGFVAMRHQEAVTLPSAEASLGPFHAMPLMDTFFKMTLQELGRMKTEVIFLDMPITPITDQKLPENYRQDYEKYMTDSIAPFQNIKKIGDILPMMPLERFADAFHLNPDGALEYSHQMKPILISNQEGDKR